MDPRLMANALLPRQSDQLMDNWYQQNKLMEQTPPWQQNHGILSAPQPRPQDWHNRSGVTDYVANAINPAMIGYGAGQMAGEARNALLEGHYGEAGGLGILAAMGVMPGAKARPARSVDSLGYYSGALEAAKGLKQAKGTPEQMLAMLQKSGAKAGEIEATGLGKFLEGRPSVTRDEIVQHLEGNRIGLKEVNRTGYDPALDAKIEEANRRRDWNEANRLGAIVNASEAKWSSYSLDPSNPTYRETVLHLPSASKVTPRQRDEVFGRFEDELRAAEAVVPRDQWPHQLVGQDRITQIADMLRASDQTLFNRLRGVTAGAEAADRIVAARRAADEISRERQPAISDFRSGHFDEPNIVGHMMTSMAKHEGKPVYLIDQIQSDWGQKLRDGGVRDEAKIAELRKRVGELEAGKKQWEAGNDPSFTQHLPEYQLKKAELRTLEASSPGHPLVNTTDQWTNTTLRRALQQAADSDAQGLAIPHGDTVLSYNPGDDGGMRGFYGSRVQEGIVPKNLRKLLSSADPAYPGPSRIETLETSAGPRGWNALESNPFDQSQTGFTYFPLTDAARAKIKEGLPLFSAAGLGILGAPAGMNALYGGDSR